MKHWIETMSNQNLESSNKDLKLYKEDKYLKSYNQEFKESMTSFKVNHPVGQESKLFYHFESNNNSSISSTTGQIDVRYK